MAACSFSGHWQPSSYACCSGWHSPSGSGNIAINYPTLKNKSLNGGKRNPTLTSLSVKAVVDSQPPPPVAEPPTLHFLPSARCGIKQQLAIFQEKRIVDPDLAAASLRAQIADHIPMER